MRSFKASPGYLITDAFKEYINNELPTRLIDTSTMQFVSRRDVFRIFQDRIADITEERVQERIRMFQGDPLATYQPRRKAVLRQIIQEIVQFVILSHHWDENTGEPSYQDISSWRRFLPRSKKLSQFCKTSRKLGYKLAWIDTCCIDQTNAAELSEAIHAMYKWYANAYLCVVYLAESYSFKDWSTDPWFSRGWTLQELLAPKRVKFYDKHWQPFVTCGIDDRKLDQVILHLENVTSISKEVLAADNSRGVQGCTFWEIMSWASKRQTTRIEDRAYSLIGLFHVSLAIAYGEGQRAFSRLLEAISAKNPNWDVFAWFGQPSMDHFAFPSSPASYSGFDTDIGKDRGGIRNFTIAPHGLSFLSLPPIPMEARSVKAPKGSGDPFLVHLRQRCDTKISLGSYGDLVVECGATRIKTICGARHLSACIINHHTTRSREQGKLVFRREYICLLLYSESEHRKDGETIWTKLITDNLLRISCLEPETAATGGTVIQESDGFVLPLVTTFIQSPTAEPRNSGLPISS